MRYEGKGPLILRSRFGSRTSVRSEVGLPHRFLHFAQTAFAVSAIEEEGFGAVPAEPIMISGKASREKARP